MASKRLVDVEIEQAKRALRARCARLRRQIDADLDNLSDEVRGLTSWRTYVRRYPAPALAAAFGAGLALSAGPAPRHWPRRLGGWLASAAFSNLQAGVWKELVSLLTRGKAI